MPVFLGQLKRRAPLFWFACGSLLLSAAVLLVRVCTHASPNQSGAPVASDNVARVESDERNASSIGPSALTQQAAFEREATSTRRLHELAESDPATRFPEAVAAARLMLEQYPNTPWASDVERHLLINPMSDPSERGYGHRSELE
jgi:hypothetical protein